MFFFISDVLSPLVTHRFVSVLSVFFIVRPSVSVKGHTFTQAQTGFKHHRHAEPIIIYSVWTGHCHCDGHVHWCRHIQRSRRCLDTGSPCLHSVGWAPFEKFPHNGWKSRCESPTTKSKFVILKQSSEFLMTCVGLETKYNERVHTHSFLKIYIFILFLIKTTFFSTTFHQPSLKHHFRYPSHSQLHLWHLLFVITVILHTGFADNIQKE